MSGHAHVVYGPRILNEPKASGCTDILYNIVEANAADCCRLYSQDLTWMIFYSEKNIRYTSSFIFMIFFCFLMINEIIAYK